jgi:glycosyltransferase involved in cell wall biosynthesis
MSVRLYGRTIGNGSLATVTRGFQQAITSAGLLEGVYAIDKSGGSEEEDPPPGALVRDGIFTGNMNLAPMMRIGTRHERHWVQVTPNSTHIPQKLLGAVLDLPGPHILSCSRWGTNVILRVLHEMGGRVRCVDGTEHIEFGDKRVEILTVHHGVQGFAPVPEELEKNHADYEQGAFRVVHFSTSDGQRKGTLELLQAWAIANGADALPADAELRLVLDHHAHQALRSAMVDREMSMPPQVKVLPRGGMDAAEMSRFLCQHHLLVAPSRAEGFGLGPLEARACGVPVVATVMTGHSAGHCEGPGVVAIAQSGALEPIDDGPGAMAPAVQPHDIAVSLVFAASQWEHHAHQAELAAEQVAAEWSWEKQLEPLVRVLRG